MERSTFGKVVVISIAFAWVVLAVFLAWATPDRLILYEYYLGKSSNMWNVEIRDVTNFNQVLFFDIEICPKDSIYYKLFIQGTNINTGTYGKSIYEIQGQSTIECKKTNLY